MAHQPRRTDGSRSDLARSATALETRMASATPPCRQPVVRAEVGGRRRTRPQQRDGHAYQRATSAGKPESNLRTFAAVLSERWATGLRQYRRIMGSPIGDTGNGHIDATDVIAATEWSDDEGW